MSAGFLLRVLGGNDYKNKEDNGNEVEEARDENPVSSCFGCELDIDSRRICSIWGESSLGIVLCTGNSI